MWWWTSISNTLQCFCACVCVCRYSCPLRTTLGSSFSCLPPWSLVVSPGMKWLFSLSHFTGPSWSFQEYIIVGPSLDYLMSSRLLSEWQIQLRGLPKSCLLRALKSFKAALLKVRMILSEYHVGLKNKIYKTAKIQISCPCPIPPSLLYSPLFSEDNLYLDFTPRMPASVCTPSWV